MTAAKDGRNGSAPGYGEDMAYVHQHGHSDFAQFAAPATLEHLHAAGIDRGVVVDLGCGTGVMARELVRAGYDVIGIDLSPDMIRLARETAPKASFRHGSFVDVALPGCAAITAIGQSLGYAFDARNSIEERRRFFSRAHRALVPGGILIFDLNAPREEAEDVQAQSSWYCRDTPDWTLVSRTAAPGGATLTRDFIVFRRMATGISVPTSGMSYCSTSRPQYWRNFIRQDSPQRDSTDMATCVSRPISLATGRSRNSPACSDGASRVRSLGVSPAWWVIALPRRVTRVKAGAEHAGGHPIGRLGRHRAPGGVTDRGRRQ